MALPTESTILLEAFTSSIFKLQDSTIALAETSRRTEARAFTLQAVLAELIASGCENAAQGELIGRALLRSLDRLRGRFADAGDTKGGCWTRPFSRRSRIWFNPFPRPVGSRALSMAELARGSLARHVDRSA